MKKMKKLSAIILSGMLAISLSACLEKDPMANIDLSTPDPVSTSAQNTDDGKDNTVTDNPGTADNPGSTDNPGTTDNPEPDVVDTSSVPAVQSGEAVLYNGQILFREYHPFQMESTATWGEFARDSITYGGGGYLCSFDPKNPEGGPSKIIEDSGFGDMYLINGEELYSQAFTYESGEEKWRYFNKVYKTNLKTSESEDICEGTIRGFSPDGKYFTVDDYAYDPYLIQYYVYDTSNTDKPVANYTSDSGITYLGMDNSNLYFMETDDNYEDFYIMQLGFDGSEYVLAKCNFKEELDEYLSAYPEFYDRITITSDKLSFGVDFYEGTGHFYFASIDVTVPIATDETPSTDPLFEAELTDSSQEEDPNMGLPKDIVSFQSYPGAIEGYGFAKVIQYYNTFDEGTFFAIADCHRYPFTDVGWRQSYFFFNLEYCFVPAGAKEYTVIDKMYGLLGEKGNLIRYEVYEEMPTMFVYCGFVYDENKELVGIYYEPVEIDGPESPIDESETYYIAELADDFYYEYFDYDNGKPEEEYLEVTDKDSFTSVVYSYEDAPVKPAEYDYEGYLVFAENEDYTLTRFNSFIYHIAFNSDGEVYYARPVMFD